MPRKSSPQSGELLDSWGRRNRKHANKQCEVCGKSFHPRKASSRFCSRPCLWKTNGGHNRKPETWWINQKGYIEGRVWINGMQIKVKKHRWIIEQHLGRKLSKHDDVHHKNGIKTDNRIENLEVISHSDHSRLTNLSRKHKRGYKLNLSMEERMARSVRMKLMRLSAIAKSKGRSNG